MQVFFSYYCVIDCHHEDEDLEKHISENHSKGYDIIYNTSNGKLQNRQQLLRKSSVNHILTLENNLK